jgi:hypothetical protein
MSVSLFSRRSLIERGLYAVPALALLPGIAKAAGGACADPTESLHASLHYVETAPDQTKSCATCGFFDAAGEGGCGTCKIFNGPTNPKGHCDSWAAKGE